MGRGSESGISFLWRHVVYVIVRFGDVRMKIVIVFARNVSERHVVPAVFGLICKFYTFFIGSLVWESWNAVV